MKYLVLFTSVLFALTHSATAHYPAPVVTLAADTSVMPVDGPQFLEGITAGEDLEEEDEYDQDGGKKKGSKSAKTTTKKSTVASPSKRLAALTPDEENMIRDLPRKHQNQKAIGIELTTPLNFKYAILLDVPIEMINDPKLLETIESWYGTRYRFGGQDRDGVDCSGFTKAFMSAYYDVNIPRSSQDQYKESDHVKKKKLRQGDLVFFKTRGAKKGITHVGVYLCNNKFVHAATSSGVMISDLDEEYYSKRFAGGGRVN